MLMIASVGTDAATTLTVTVSGADPNNWNAGSLGLADIASPESDFTATPTGPNPTIDIDIGRAPAGAPDRTISVTMNGWNPATASFTVWIMPISQGNGGTWVGWGPLVAPGTWTQIPASPTKLVLYLCRRNRVNVTFRLQLRNLSASAGAATFQSTLVYTWQ
jgi:hypothetical protein